MKALDKFKEIYENRHEYARQWKQRHPEGKVLGYFCTYLPEEIVYAAGILPVRILGSHEIEDVTAPHLFGMYCPFCRDVLAQGLQGRYDYLDGIAGCNGCMHMLQAFESWALNLKIPYFRIDFPQSVQSRHAKNFLRTELECFKEEDIETWLGKKIADEDLDRAIQIYNKNRQLLRQLYELRKADNPPLTGLETLYVVTCSQFMDKEEHNELLEAALEELKERKLDREVGTRLMMVGSENDDIEFINMVENKLVLPTTVVIDDHCNGSRYFWNEVIPQNDRLYALASRYIERPPCANKDVPEYHRFPHILKLAKEWRVEGIIVLQQKFCDPYELEIPELRKYLEENGMPTYFLELDVTVPIGQFQTRIEAFIESLMAEIV